MRTVSAVMLLAVVLLLGVASPGAAGQVTAAPAQTYSATHAASHAASFNRTRFVLHLAVAAFLIHYIYKKYEEHKLGRFHIFTDIKAAAAALIAYHELKEAYSAAKTSNSKVLHLLIEPITLVTDAVDSAINNLKHGDTSSLSSLNTTEDKLISLASKYGFGHKDVAPSGFGGF